MYGTITPNKSGGCRGLISYLEKEESLSQQFTQYLDKESSLDQQGYFFNGENRMIDKEEVVVGIDNNCKRLKLDESRFFSLTLNPSAREILHLEKLADVQIQEMKRLGIFQAMSASEEQVRDGIVKDLLRQYTVKSMDQYALNFGREGIRDNQDLVWFGRVEKNRYWKYSAPEVQHNRRIDSQINRLLQQEPSMSRSANVELLQKQYILESDVRVGGRREPIREMMPKSGKNYHVHIVVSRRDREQKRSLSPLAKARSNDKHLINGKECKIGFNRDAYTQKLETVFDNNFEYTRRFSECYQGKKLFRENPEQYKMQEAEYNAQKGITADYEKNYTRGRSSSQGYSVRQAQVQRIGQTQLTSAGNRLAQAAGLNYINDSIKPYREAVSTGYQGIKVLTSSWNSTRHAAQMGKTMTNCLARGAGLTSLANPYMFAARVGMKVISAFTQGL